MAIRSQGHSTSPYDSVMLNTGKNASAVDYDPPIPPIITYGDRGLFYAGSQWAPGWGNSQVIDYINLAPQEMQLILENQHKLDLNVQELLILQEVYLLDLII